jgi:ubiquinone/menaquinone biosynthesis C-methylase UbiE
MSELPTAPERTGGPDECDGAPGAPRDPVPGDWSALELPAAWPDALRLSRPSDAWRVFRKVVLRRLDPVQLPAGLPLDVELPPYLLQEFHNLPNGNYSRGITRGYSKGFDLSMLGTLRAARRELAGAVRGSASALDLGCGAGHSTRVLRDAEVPDVWGLDASPYLLQHAARLHPGLPFVQGLAERTRFPSRRFEVVSASFLFHELPPRIGDAVLREARRLLVPGGRLCFLEPGPEQRTQPPLALLRRHGPRGLYFAALARFVNEPFFESWRQRDVPAWLDAHGFELESLTVRFPSRICLARLR